MDQLFISSFQEERSHAVHKYADHSRWVYLTTPSSTCIVKITNTDGLNNLLNKRFEKSKNYKIQKKFIKLHVSSNVRLFF